MSLVGRLPFYVSLQTGQTSDANNAGRLTGQADPAPPVVDDRCIASRQCAFEGRSAATRAATNTVYIYVSLIAEASLPLSTHKL